MKKCSKCGIEKSRSEFHKDHSRKDGLHCWCKLCMKEYQQSDAGRVSSRKASAKHSLTPAGTETNRKSSAKHREKFPEKTKARKAVSNAVRDGRLIRPNHCESCFKECRPHGHYDSYKEEDWFKVDWVCKRCHRKLDEEKKSRELNCV